MIHNSPKAEELRGEIRSMISAGWSDADIQRDLTGRFSTRILVVPEGTAATWLSWTPWALTAAGLLTVAAVIRSSVRSAAASPPGPPTAVPPLPDSDWE